MCQNNPTGKYNACRKGAEDPEVMFKVFYVIKVKNEKNVPVAIWLFAATIVIG